MRTLDPRLGPTCGPLAPSCAFAPSGWAFCPSIARCPSGASLADAKEPSTQSGHVWWWCSTRVVLQLQRSSRAKHANTACEWCCCSACAAHPAASFDVCACVQIRHSS